MRAGFPVWAYTGLVSRVEGKQTGHRDPARAQAVEQAGLVVSEAVGMPRLGFEASLSTITTVASGGEPSP
jgi:hypothetical protein